MTKKNECTSSVLRLFSSCIQRYFCFTIEFDYIENYVKVVFANLLLKYLGRIKEQRG